MHSATEFSKDLSIIIVSYNTRELTRSCIQSIYDSNPTISFEIIVYDNASHDGSVEVLADYFPRIKIIASDTNIGFAAGNNIARGSAEGKRLLLLNPDTTIISDGIDALFQFASAHRNTGIFGGASYTLSNELDYRSCWGKPSLWSLICRSLGLSVIGKNMQFLNSEALPNFSRDRVKDVGVVSGCFFLLDAKVWDELDGFDNDYFMYSEEADLCARAQTLGHDCVFVPHAKIMHVGSASESSQSHKTTKLLNGKSLYYQKHWNSIERFCAGLLIDIFVLSRTCGFNLASTISKSYSEEAAHWSTVWASRHKWHMKYTILGRTVTYKISEILDEHLQLDTVTYYKICDSSQGRLP
jgi:N-acetylglucosaminyl-diphospho-decaprenol L-rhamnosyltransferase